MSSCTSVWGMYGYADMMVLSSRHPQFVRMDPGETHLILMRGG